jgi:formylglycine-generating enzyme required for sulfatase activity
MKFKFIILTVILNSFLGTVTAQSKKEQIVILLNRIDSLNLVIEEHRKLSLESMNLSNFKLDAIVKKLNEEYENLNRLTIDLELKKNESEALISENRKIENELLSIKEENSKFQFKLDSSKSSNVEIEMVYVEGGTFQMGSNNGDYDEKPVHKVTLSSFFIGKYEVTEAQYSSIMGDCPWLCECPNCPIVDGDVEEYIRRLNAKTAKNYRLPTEAEWEFAARGGNYSKGYSFSGSNFINDVAIIGVDSVYGVGQKQPNELGIYDMSGNVWEWCSDRYGDYTSSSQINPKGAKSGKEEVLRGGGYFDDSDRCRVTNRGNYVPDWNLPDPRGFRLVLPVNL